MRLAEGHEFQWFIDWLSKEIKQTPASSRGPLLIEINQTIDVMQGIFADGFHSFEKSGAFASDGDATPSAWLRHRCRMTSGAASDCVKVSRALVDLQETSEALASGEIGYHHARLIARTASDLGIDVVAPRESILVDAARQVDSDAFSKVTRHLKHMVDQDRALDDANAIHERRRLHISSTLDGVVYIEGQLDSEGGAFLQAAVNALPDVAATKTVRRARAGDRKFGGGRDRSREDHGISASR